MTTPPQEAYEAAAVAHERHLATEHGEGLNGVVDALWPIAERHIRAQIAAEIRGMLPPSWGYVDSVQVEANHHGFNTARELAARIAEGGQT